jgi:hypothetical protein
MTGTLHVLAGTPGLFGESSAIGWPSLSLTAEEKGAEAITGSDD